MAKSSPPIHFFPEDALAHNNLDWFQAPEDPSTPNIGKWFRENIKLEYYTTTKSGVEDFEKSLQKERAIIVYIGHSTLTPAKMPKGPEGPSQGLSPDHPKKGPEIPNKDLRTWLSLLRFENRRWKYKRRAAHYRRKLRGHSSCALRSLFPSSLNSMARSPKATRPRRNRTV